MRSNFLTLIGVFLAVMPVVSMAADDPLSFSKPITEPITSFTNQYGLITNVIKTYDKFLADGTWPPATDWIRFRYSFLGKLPKNKLIFIPIFDGSKKVDAFDGHTGDCSLEKTLLAKDNSQNIYLFIARRSPPTDSKTLLMQYQPSPERIQAFILVNNYDAKILSKPPIAYFDKMGEYLTDESVCTEEEVYELMKKKANSLINHTERK